MKSFTGTESGAAAKFKPLASCCVNVNFHSDMLLTNYVNNPKNKVKLTPIYL